MKKLIYFFAALFFGLHVCAQTQKGSVVKVKAAKVAGLNSLASFKLGEVKHVNNITNPKTGKTLEITEYHTVAKNKNETYRYFTVKEASVATYHIQVYKLVGSDYTNAQVAFKDVNPYAMDNDPFWTAVGYGYQRVEKWGLCTAELMEYLYCHQQCDKSCEGFTQCVFNGAECGACVVAAMASCRSQL
jgi:hypothetical protein